MIQRSRSKTGRIAFTVALLFLLSLGMSAASLAMNLRLGGTQTPSHPGTKYAKKFAEMVKEKSGGEITVEVLFGGVLGGEREIVEGVQFGNIEMGAVSDIGMATVVPSIGFAYLPYLCTSYEEVDEKYYNGWIGEIVKKRMEEKNIKILKFMDNDFRWITNSKQPVVKPQDLEGMSLRVPEIPELIQFFNELDAQPTTMAVTEVVPALQQGAVDGQDNGAILNYTFGFYEFQPYMTITNHVFSGGGIIINNNLWNNLSSKNKQIIKDSARECFAEGNAELRSKVALYTKKMKEKGVQVDTPSPELEAAMEKAARAVYENPKNVDRYGKEVMNKILNQ